MQDPGRNPRAADRLTPAALQTSTYRGRFAPSPTGPLHRGSLLTALAGWLDARHQHGVWLVRIEDLDPDRSDPQAADGILRTLERFGLYWDETVWWQSRRLDVYRNWLERLQQADRVYPCACSRKQLAELGYSGERYPNRCRLRPASRRQPHALRLKTEDCLIELEDRLQGRFGLNLAESGDFVVRRRDEVYAYHLAVVVDDYEQQVTHVVRGCDLLDSTPRHIYLQQQLGLPTPVYLHLPVLVDRHGYKLSKQTGAAAADALAPSATLFRLLQQLGQQPPPSLYGADPAILLAWGREHWNAAALPCGRALAAE